MHFLKPILAAAVLAIAIGLVCEIVAFRQAIDLAALAFAVAAWVVPLSMLAWPTKPRSSLASVGASIGILVIAAILSVVGIVLAILTLLFATGPNWAWLSLSTIAALWIAGIIALNLPRRAK